MNNEGAWYASDVQGKLSKCSLSEWMNEERSVTEEMEVKYQESRREGDRAAGVGANRDLGGCFEKG